MRIAVIKPPPHPGTIRMERLISVEPLELEYLYSALKEYHPLIIDCSRTRKNPLKQITSFQPDLIVITAYITHLEWVLCFSEKMKRAEHQPIIFVGGPHAEVCPEHFFSAHIDAVFFAGQLTALNKSIERLELGQPYHDIPGVATASGAQFQRCEGLTNPDLKLPAPERIFFNPNPGKYFYLQYKRCAAVKTALGCPGCCSFCFCRHMNGGRYSPRQIEDGITEIESLDADSILFVGDNFLVNPSRLLAFADLVHERGIEKNFIAYGTAAFVVNHPDVVLALKNAGLNALIIGFEFIDDDELKSVRKGATVADNIRAAAILDQLGLDLVALFIISPRYSHDHFRRLARFIRQNPIYAATFSTETLLPGAENFSSPDPFDNHDSIIKNSWRYDLLRLHEKPKHMSAPLFYCWLYYLYLMPYLSPKKALRLARNFSFSGAIIAFTKAAFTGIEYLLKLLFWH